MHPGADERYRAKISGPLSTGSTCISKPQPLGHELRSTAPCDLQLGSASASKPPAIDSVSVSLAPPYP